MRANFFIYETNVIFVLTKYFLMNADQIEILGTLRNNLKKLMTKLENERKRSELLESELRELKDQFEKQGSEFEILEHKYNTLKLAKTLAADTEEGHDARIRVNRMVREIDKCIALLNR